VVRRYRYVRQVLVSNLYAGASPARISQIGRVISRIGRMILWPCRKSCSKGRNGTYLPVVLACRVAQAVNVLRGAYLLLLPSSSQGRVSGADARCMYHVSCPRDAASRSPVWMRLIQAVLGSRRHSEALHLRRVWSRRVLGWHL
jgi:hypothetical protein